VSTHVRLRLGDEEYALPVEWVSEVVDVGVLAPVPGAPASVLGIRNLRGRILPVFDLGALLGVRSGNERTRVVVAGEEHQSAGLAVDGVSDVCELPEPDEETQSPFLRGAVLADGALVGIVDVQRVLAALEAEGD